LLDLINLVAKAKSIYLIINPDYLTLIINITIFNALSAKCQDCKHTHSDMSENEKTSE